ncbi:MAG: TonB-dependent receptor [Candidatus Nitricoxidivorans perseverans]|uniref:TonB-dependent receptor n=1 Tax=Candidatus Nitricoxidivorans perseverans TaxID=2975601 RepID=A0AA49IXP3_9PROT|nr:MAG: TonB-dependent receptor [Candidatus Nitricoxidivorans perseverans]
MSILNRKARNLRPLASLLVFLPAATAFGQETVLKEVVVTSTTIDDRFTSKRSEPSSIHDISGKTVDEKRPENMIDLLRSIPGVTADLSSGDEIKIKLRGIENQRYMGEKPGVAIVIDGVPVFERTGKVNVDLDNIESIKVIKGGASYLFGDDALTGAVIVTTKRGAKYRGVTVSADEGAWGYNRQQVRAGFASDWGTGHIQATHRQSEDYYWQSGYKTDYIDGNLRMFLTDASDLTFGFEQSDRMKDKHGSVKGATQAALDPMGTVGRDYTRKYDVNLQKFHMTYSNDLTERSNILATAYEYQDRTSFWSAPQRNSATGTTISDSTPGAQELYTTLNDYDQVQRGVKAEWRTSAGDVGWLGGLDLRRNRYKNFNTAKVDYCSRTDTSAPIDCFGGASLVTAGTVMTDNTTDEAISALYGEFKFLATPQWTLTLNGRYDAIGLDFTSGRTNEVTTPFSRSKSFGAASWRGGANYAVNDGTDLFGNLSTGFRAPTADQLYNGSLSPTGGKTLNNENLKPEKALNLELGVRARTEIGGIAAEVEAAAFQIERKDFILATNGQYSTSTSTAQQMYDNIGGVRNRGIELSLKTDRKRTFTLDAAYSYIQAKFTRYDNFNLTLGNSYAGGPGACNYTNTPSSTACRLVLYNVAGNDVPRVPRHQLNTTFGWQPGDRFRLALEMDAKSWSWADEINQEKWAGRTLFNLAANYDIREAGFLGAKWSLFMRVNNLFDKRYWSAARGTNDASHYVTGAYDGVYNAEDLSIVVGKPRNWTVGLTANF